MAKQKPPPVTLEFGEPPRTKRQYRWRDVAAGLRKRPGEWALVQRDIPASVPSAVAGGRVSSVHPDLGFRVTTAKNRRPSDGPRRTGEMWMMYDPELDKTRKNGVKK